MFTFIKNKPIIVLFSVGIIVRLIVFTLFINQHSVESIITLTPDVENYHNAAVSIYEDNSYDSIGVIIFGPGYPLFITFFMFVLNLSVYGLLIIQIILSAAASVFLYKFALLLTKDSSIALTAGFLNALSVTSIALSHFLLSETLFFFGLTVGFYLLLLGIQQKKNSHIVISGLIFCLLIFVRIVAMYAWIFAFFFIALDYFFQKKRSYKKLFKQFILPILIGIIIVLTTSIWKSHNEYQHGFSYVSLAQPGGFAQLTRSTQSLLGDTTNYFLETAFDDELSTDDSSKYDQFSHLAKNSLMNLIKTHPWGVIKSYSLNISENINCDYMLQMTLFPKWKDFLLGVTSFSYKKGLNYRVSLLVLIGFIMLIKQKKYELTIILFALYLFFVLPAGFSIHQGARVFYPGHLAWTIIAAYPLLALFRYFKKFTLKK